MPTQELIESIESNTLRPTFENSRDYRGSDFNNYIDPDFYRGNMPPYQGLLIRDQLRQNGEVYAFNKPALYDLDLRGYQVSPIIPEGIYKNRTLARVYFWKDGKQIMKRYRLISLSQVNPQQVSDQVIQNLFSRMTQWSIDFWGSAFMSAITLGIGKSAAQGLELLKREIDGYDVYGVWVEEGSLTQNLSAVTGRGPSQGLLESLGITDEQLQTESRRSALPLILAGAGLITGNLWLSGIGLLLRFRQ